MSERATAILATVALVSGGITLTLSVLVALVAGAQGSSGGATAFLGLLATVPLSGLACILSVAGIALARVPRVRTRALVGLGLALLGPILFVALVALLVPESAFKI